MKACVCSKEEEAGYIYFWSSDRWPQPAAFYGGPSPFLCHFSFLYYSSASPNNNSYLRSSLTVAASTSGFSTAPYPCEQDCGYGVSNPPYKSEPHTNSALCMHGQPWTYKLRRWLDADGSRPYTGPCQERQLRSSTVTKTLMGIKGNWSQTKVKTNENLRSPQDVS